MSGGFAHGLFLLVLIKAVSSAISPWNIAVPVPIPRATPTLPPTPHVVDVEAPEARPQIARLVGQAPDFKEIDSAPAPISPSPIVVDASPRPSNASWLMLAWGMITAGLLARLAACHARFASRVRGAGEIDPATLPVDASLLARRAGLSRRVPLLQSDQVRAPAVWGLLAPRVLIPAGMLRGLSTEQATWILLHEFAHIRRKDIWVVLAQRIIQSAFFFHPAVWAANRLADVQREFACDESALALGNVSRRGCGEGFLTIAERARRPRAAAAPSLGLFGSSTLIRKRLERLLDETRPPSARLSRSAVVMLAAVALVAVARIQAQPQPAPAPAVSSTEPKPGAKERTIEVSVVDSRTGKPMPGVAIVTQWNDGSKGEKTDESGRCVVTIPHGDLIYVRLKARKDGFVPLEDRWNLQGALAKPLPEKCTFKMEPGNTIGGVIQDEQGRPIAGATVFVGFFFPRRDVVGPTPFLLDEPCVTDASGRWQCKIMPARLPVLMLRLAHPDYVSGSEHSDTPPPEMAKLRDGSRVMVMKKGLPVSGVVLDREGKPIAGARVASGKDQAATGNPITTTNAQGEFLFAHVAPGELILVVQAKGHAPELQQIKVEPQMPPVEFTLGPPHSIRGRIVDGAGKPIPGAWITDDEWRGYRSLNLKVVADADGRFQIDDLPDSPVQLQFSKEGFMNLPNQVFTPSGQDVVITLNRPLTISGTVTDAATGKPIGEFTLYDGQGAGGWDRQSPRQFRDGRYIRNIIWPYPQTVVFRIEAEGYLPAESRGFQITEGTVTYDFRLTKGEIPTRSAISGVILLPGGKPAAGAEVVLASKSRGIYVRNGRVSRPDQHPSTQTKLDGTFAFPPQIEESLVMAFHDQGYAEVTEDALAKTPARSLTLHKWGRVEGTLRVGTKPAADERVVLNPKRADIERFGRMFFSYEAKTGRLGRFAFERVVPGPANISRGIATAPNQMGFGPWKTIEVEPGGTARVRIGGTGRPIIGRFARPAESDLPIDWMHIRHQFRLKSPPGPQLRGATKEERVKEYQKWITTDEGKAYDAWQKDRRFYAFRIETDGSFRIDDVTAGTYELFVTALDGAANGRKPLAEAERIVIVPEMEGGQSVEPLDLGTIEIVPTP
jgi:beta-lactamase regulating signal transducer with metallopeptidase domain